MQLSRWTRYFIPIRHGIPCSVCRKTPTKIELPDIGSSSREQLQILTKLRDDIMRIADMSAAIDMVQGSRKKLMATDCLQQSYSLELPHWFFFWFRFVIFVDSYSFNHRWIHFLLLSFTDAIRLYVMNESRCPVCSGETIEIRSKLMCRTCGMILETCCEGGPMGNASDCQSKSKPSSQPEELDDSETGWVFRLEKHDLPHRVCYSGKPLRMRRISVFFLDCQGGVQQPLPGQCFWECHRRGNPWLHTPGKIVSALFIFRFWRFLWKSD